MVTIRLWIGKFEILIESKITLMSLWLCIWVSGIILFLSVLLAHFGQVSDLNMVMLCKSCQFHALSIANHVSGLITVVSSVAVPILFPNCVQPTSCRLVWHYWYTDTLQSCAVCPKCVWSSFCLFHKGPPCTQSGFKCLTQIWSSTWPISRIKSYYGACMHTYTAIHVLFL